VFSTSSRTFLRTAIGLPCRNRYSPSVGTPPVQPLGTGDDERERLFRSTLRVLRRNGYAGAQVSDILADAGLGTRAFYRHFGSKDELLVALFHENAAQTRARLEERVRQAGSPTEALVAWLDELLDLAYDQRRASRARLFHSGASQAAFGDVGERALDDLYAPLREVLAAGQASGDFPTADLEHDAGAIHALVWRFFWSAVRGDPVASKDEAREVVLRFVLGALR
jgi:AcrR family transcriptional regulator